jgi:glycosyltransferase involved in cell wall biosynthesis
MRGKSDHTFVILAYKESPYLEHCISSLLQQTVKSEIHLSTSTPSAFLENISLKCHIPLTIYNQSEGIASDWSFALAQGKTKYITLAHQDDMYLPQYTEYCVSAAEKIQTNLITFTDYDEIFDGTLRKHNLLLLTKRMIVFPFYVFKQHISSSFLKRLMLSPGNPICCPSIMYNKDNIGRFEFDAAFSMNLDWEAALRLAEMSGDFIYIRKKMVHRRIHKGSESTHALQTYARQNEDRILFERLWPKPVANVLLSLYATAYKSNG